MRAGDAITDMAYFTARAGRPSEYCRQRVRECDVYVAGEDFTHDVSGRVFISYRWEEAAYPAAWLRDRLVRHFSDGEIKDADSVERSDDYLEAVVTTVESCDVLLVVIGDRWLTIADAAGRRCLEDPDDLVRLEVA